MDRLADPAICRSVDPSITVTGAVVISEQRHLFAELLGLDRTLAHQLLHVARRRRRMPGEVIVHVAIYIETLLGQLPHDARPGLELTCAIDLDTREIDDRAVGAHPAGIDEIRRRPARQRQHLLSRNPLSVSQRKRDVMLGKQRDHAIMNPAAIPELDGETRITRKLGQELRESRKLRRTELRSELDEDRSQLRSKLTGTVHELFENAVGVPKFSLVRDLLRHLERKRETIRRALGPPTNRLRCRYCVEGRIDFDGVECAAVDAEEFTRARSVGVKRTDPGVVIPTLRSEADATGHIPREPFSRKR